MNILIVAPHRDDELIGVGGTLLKHKAAGDTVTVCLVTAGEGHELPPATARIHKEMQAAHAFCGVDRYVGLPYFAKTFDEVERRELNGALLSVFRDVRPDVVYLPFWGDMQEDHKKTFDAAMVALRCKYALGVKRILCYETLSETGIGAPVADSAFIPNVYTDISAFLEKKKEALRFYASQLHPFPDLRSEQSVEALARFRGAAVNTEAAEAFMLVREIG